jgi:hypothetical protein
VLPHSLGVTVEKRGKREYRKADSRTRQIFYFSGIVALLMYSKKKRLALIGWRFWLLHGGGS